jgi:hypothetical protein
VSLSESIRSLDILAELLRRDPPNFQRIESMAEDAWSQTIALANLHRLTPALYEAMDSNGTLEVAPASVRGYLRFLHDSNARRNSAIRRQVEELARTLAEVQIRPVFLKGAATLFDGPYFGLGGRMIGDVDVLIPRQAVERGLAVLCASGYRLIRRYPVTHNAFGDLVKDGAPAAIDVHLDPIDAPHVMYGTELRATAFEVRYGELHLMIPDRTYRVLHNLLHAEIHDVGGYYHGRLLLRDLHEFAVMCNAFRADVDWDFVNRRMRQHRIGPVLESYVFAANRLFGARCPIGMDASVRARVHYVRRIAQFRWAWLGRLGRPWWNIRAAFAHHRMKALYAYAGGRAFQWRLRHGRRYLAKHTLSVAVGRLLRA